MKIVPVLAITNALALALAIFVYVKQGESQPGGRRAEAGRTDSAELAAIRAELDELKRAQPGARAHPVEAASDAPAAGATPGAPAGGGGTDAPLASPPAADGAAAPGAADEFDPQEMVTFRKKVRKANELNSDEDQENGIKDQVDRLVRDNKIAPLTPAQKDGVAKVVVSSRRKGVEIFRKLRESGSLEGANREDRGRIVRQEMETIRADTQRQLEEIMPAVDVKTYLDETTRDMGRFGGFGFGQQTGAPGAPVPPSPGR